MKKIYAIMFVLVTMFTFSGSAVYAENPKIGSVVDYTIPTDIVTYVNGYPIKSYNINGYTAICVEDLADYGFSVRYIDDYRELYLDLSELEATPTVTEVRNLNDKRSRPILYTDIITFLEPSRNFRVMRSFNINGETIIYVDDLAAVCGDFYKYDDNARTLTLTTVKPWSVEVINEDYSWETSLNDATFFMFEKQSDNTFKTVESGGDYEAIYAVKLGQRSVEFSEIMLNYGSLDFTGGMVNVNYERRLAEDTLERRQELSKYFRVYVNEKLVLGELAFTQGNGHTDYTFTFEKYQKLDDIKTIRLELGSN